MKQATEKLGVSLIKEFLKDKLQDYLDQPFVVMYYDEFKNDFIFKVMLKYDKTYIFLNDFELQADFLYDDEVRLRNQWFALVSNKYKQMGKDYMTEYKKFVREKYQDKADKEVKEFEENFKVIKELEKQYEM